MHRVPFARPASPALLVILALAGLSATASAAPAPTSPVPAAAQRLVDVRLAERDRLAATGADTGIAARSPATADRVKDARAALRSRLGRQAVLDVDPLTGSVRQLSKLDGALTGPTGAAPATTARDFAHGNANALGLDPSDVNALHVADQQRSASGLTVVRFAQEVDGIPAFDSGLRVAVDRAGRAVQVAGAPRSDLPADLPATPPPLSAADALQRLMDESGVHRSDVAVTSTGADARRTTRFSTGDGARLTLFGARTVHLAWHLTYQATSTLWYDAVVDATTGEVLYRANLVKSVVNANVYENYPGAPVGGAQTTVDLAPFLTSTPTTLSGPNVHAWADTNDNDGVDAGEEVAPAAYGPLTDNNRPDGACDATHVCSWNHVSSDWMVNASQNVTQAFYYANKYHDHLAAAPIRFDAASGSFDGTDPLNLNALDGAATGPDADHLNNANMATPPNGESPKMQMYLFAHSTAGPAPAYNFRDVNGGDDAAVLYHEYTHGLSSRLVTYDDGSEALNRPQSGAMGEGWSDWYAQDYLVRQGLETDTGADGEIDMGHYVDSAPHSIRTQAIDCAVNSTNAAACPGGGYTFGDFAKIAGGPEVHTDGEIWVQTLWQLRQGLVQASGEQVGSDTAEQIITDAMRLSVPEPSYLDMRNAILAADLNAFGGAHDSLIWQVFAARGMGFYAAADDSSDTQPTEDFSPPPAPNAPMGSIAGTVTDRQTGAPLGSVAAGVVGLDADPIPTQTRLAGSSDAAGHYAIPSVPAGAYPRIEFRAPGGYDRATLPVTVGGGPPTTLNAELTRDWAAAAGGTTVAATSDDAGAEFGCGAAALIDQSRSFGWSPKNPGSAGPAPSTTIKLPQAIDISTYAIDPANTCNDDASAALKDYRLETSPDGSAWTTSAAGRFTASQAGTLVPVAPAAASTNVRFVRLTLLSPQGTAPDTSGVDFIDITELEIYGSPSPPVDHGGGGGEGGGGGATPPPTTTPPPVLPPPPPRVLARPTFLLPRTGTNGQAKIRVTCKTTCRVSATLTVDRATRKRYKLRSATVGRLTVKTVKGTKTSTIKLTADARKRLRARHAKKLRVTIHATATLTAATSRKTVTTKGATLKLQETRRKSASPRRG